jgi:hypothetical protein
VNTHRHASRGAVAALATFFCAALTVLTARPAVAQQLGWSGAVEANGSLFFGNVRDRLVGARAHAARADSTLEVRADARWTYSDAARDDEGRRVSGRTAFASLGTDYRPFGRYSPFWFGAIESSLQQRIDRRLSTGAGGKLTFYRQKANEASMSLAVLAERTSPRPADDGTEVPDVTRRRWSLRGRVRQAVTDAITLSHTTFYQPALTRANRFTVSSTSSLAAKMTTKVSFTVTLVDVYDSEARARGARENNDGQLLFGFKTEF